MKKAVDLAMLTQELRKAPKGIKPEKYSMSGTDYLVQHVLLPVCFDKTVQLENLDFDRFDESDIAPMCEFLQHGFSTITLQNAVDAGKPASFHHETAFC